MHDSSRALLKRGSIAAATTALVIGSSFAAAPAIATATATPEPAPSESSAAPTVEASDESGKAALPSGLEEAVERDLGITLEEFYKNGELSSVVETLTKELKQAKLEADFEIADSKINVAVAATSLEAVTEKLEELTKDTDVELNIVEEPKVEASKAPKENIQDAAPSKLSVVESPKTEAKPKAEAEPKTVVSKKAQPKNVDELLKAYAASVEPKAVSQLQAVMKTTGNKFVIRTGGAAKVESRGAKASATSTGDKLTPQQFAEQFTTVTIEKAEGPAKSAAANDVLGGMGYGAPTGGGNYSVCSIGFTGFNKSGADAAISAGHCAKDGGITDVMLLEHDAPNDFVGPGEDLGTFGFSQFGGPNNSPVTGLKTAPTVNDLGNVGTDISVVDDINKDLDLKALVTQWKTGADERESGTNVTGVAPAVIGANICKSGRTTGWTCGDVDEVGIFIVGGTDIENDPDDVRGVRGFGIANPIVDGEYTKAFQGDSGGSAIAGGNAVGVTSAISDTKGGRAYFTDIEDGLDHTEGYSIALFLNAPAVTSPSNGAEVDAEATISGTVADAPSGSKVKVVAGGKTQTVAVEADKFSFKAPATAGKYDFTLQTINGFNKSSITKGSVVVVVEPTTAPTEPTTAPTEPTTAPTEPTTAPTEPTTAPTEPTTAPTEPTTAPTEPTTAPTEPTTAPTEPTTAPTEPTTAPTEPTTAPTEPTTAPTEPTTAPTEPTTAPTEPTTAPTEPTTAPTEPTTAPTEPTTAPTEPTTAPTEPSEPTESTPEPTKSTQPSQDTEPSKAPVVPQENDNNDNDDNDGLAETGPNAALPFIATGGVLLVAGGAFMLFRRKNNKGHYGA